MQENILNEISTNPLADHHLNFGNDFNSLDSQNLNPQEILFIATNIDNYQSLFDEINPRTKVITLDPTQNGVFQISEVLARYQGLSGIHIVTHGSEGNLQLGSTNLNLDTIGNYGNDLHEWGKSLTKDADILFYGCNVAATNQGFNFIQELSDITTADIAASDDLTGNAALGGDWILESHTGEIETVGLTSHSFGEVLSATVSLSNGALVYDSNSSTDNNIFIYTENNNLYINDSTGITAGSNVTAYSTTTITVAISNVSSVAIYAGDGSDDISIGGDISLTGDFFVYGEGGTDTFSTSSNIDFYTKGGDIIVDAETIEIGDNVTISTRQISGSDHLTGTSTGNSGAITLTGKAIAIDGTTILTQVETGSSYTAGNITLAVEDTNSSKTADVSVDLSGVTLKGAEITITATAEASNNYDGITDDSSFLGVLEELFDGLFESGIGKLDGLSPVAGVARANATATINLEGTTSLTGTVVSITASSDTSAEVNPLNLGTPLAIAYGESNPTAKVIVGDSTTITTTSNLTLGSTATSNLDVATYAIGLGTLKGATKYLFSGVGVNSDIIATTEVASGVNLNVGGNLNVLSSTTKEHAVKAFTGSYDDGVLGISVTVDLVDVTSQALLDGTVTVGGNTTVNANLTTIKNDVSASSTVGPTIVSKIANAFVTGTLAKIPYLKGVTTDSRTGTADKALSGAINYAEFNNTVVARVGEGADLATIGNLSILASAQDLPEFSTMSTVSSDSASNPKGRTKNNSLSVAISLGLIDNDAQAFIGKNAEIDASGAIAIQSSTSLPLEQTWTDIFTEEAYLTKVEFNPVTTISNNQINFTSKHGLSDGDKVTYTTTGNAISGLTKNRSYTVVKISDTQIQLKDGDGNIINLDPAPSTGTKHYLQTTNADFFSVTDGITSYLDYTNPNLGLQNGLFNSWSQAISEGENVSLAGSANYLNFGNTSQAYIAEGAQINQDAAYRTVNQTVKVEALNDSKTVNFAGLTDILGTMVNFVSSIPGLSSLYGTYFGSQPDKGIGGTFLGTFYTNDVYATIDKNTAIYATDLDVLAKNTNYSISMAEAGSASAKTGDFSFNISLSISNFDNETIAHIDEGSAIVTSGSLNVNADDKTWLYNFGGAVGSSENVGIGAAAVWNEIDRTTLAVIGSLEISHSFQVDSAVDLTANTIALAGHGLKTGDMVVYSDEQKTAIGGLTDGNVYYIIAVDDDTIKLADSATNALAGQAVDLTTKVDAVQRLIVLEPIDFDPTTGEDDGNIFDPASGVNDLNYFNPEGSVLVGDNYFDPSDGVVNISSDTITIADHGLSTGDKITYSNDTDLLLYYDANNNVVSDAGVLIGGLVEQSYYAIAIDANTFKLASSYTNAINNTAINLTSTGSGAGQSFTRDILDLDNDIIYFGDHGFSTGDAVIYSQGGDSDTAIGGLTDGTTYYAIAIDTNRIKLATSLIAAQASTAINLTSAGDGGSHSLRKPTVDITNNLLNLTGHGFATGDEVIYSDGTGTAIGGLINGERYYAIAIDQNTLKLAQSYADAINSTAIDLTSTGSGEDQSLNAAALKLSQDTITITNHGFTTGDEVVYSNGGGTSIGGLTDGATYYAIAIDDDTIQLAASYNQAISGEAKNITSAGTGTNHQFASRYTPTFAANTGVTAGGTVTISSENTGGIITASLAAAKASPASPGEADPESEDAVSDSPTGGWGISGDASINTVTDTTKANINHIDLTATNQQIQLSATESTEIIAVAGAVSLAFSSKDANGQSSETSVGIAGSFAKNDITNTTQTYLDNVTLNAGSLKQTATNQSDIIGVTAGGSGAFSDKGYALAGSFTINNIDNQTQSYIKGYSDITLSNDIEFTTDDTSTIIGVAGTLSYGGKAGFGASIALNYIDNQTAAYLLDADVAADNLTLNAENDSTIISVAAALGLGLGGMAGEVAFTLNQIENTTQTYTNNLSLALTGNADLDADENADIFSLAGVVSLSISVEDDNDADATAASIGVAVAINSIENTINSYIENSDVTKTDYLSLSAISSATVKGYAIAGSLAVANNQVNGSGLSISGAGAGTDNEITNHIAAKIDLSSVSATGKISLYAEDVSTIYGDTGGVAIALAYGSSASTAAVGASISVNNINNTIQAYVDNSALAAGDISIQAKSDATVKAFALSASIAASLSSQQGQSISLSGAGAGTENKIDNTIKAKISNSTATSTGVITVKATDDSEIIADAGGFAIALARGAKAGSLSIGVAASNNDIINDITATIDKATVTTTNGTIEVKAESTATIEALSMAGALSVSGGTSGMTGAFAGAGSGSGNEIDNEISATITNSADVDATGDITLAAVDDSEITADAGGFAISAAFGSSSGYSGDLGISIATNDITNTTKAVITGLNTTVDSSTGGISLTADSSPIIDNFGLAGAVAVQQGTAAGTGTGASGDNNITNTIEAAIKDNAEVTASGTITIKATDESEITVDVGGGSLSIAAGGTTSVSLAIAVALANNTINNTVSADIDNAQVSSTSNNIDITADSNAEITATVVAVAIAVAIGSNTSIALSGGGAAATNVILTDTNAYIKDSTIADVNNLTLTTASTSEITATLAAVAAGAAAIGVSVAENYIGYTAGGTKSPTEIRAYIQDSSITASGDLTQTATADNIVTANAGAGSLGIAAGATTGYSVSISGAGVVAYNQIATKVAAFIDGDGTTGISANSITLKADDTSEITATTVSVAVAASFLGALGVAASIGFSIGRNDIGNEVAAYIQDADNEVITTNGSLTLEAIEDATIDANAVSVSLAIAALSTSASLAFSGVGAESTNIINNSVQAYVDSSTIDSAQDIILNAQSTSSINALAGGIAVAGSGGVSGSVAVSGAIGVSLARNLIGYDSITDTSGYGNEVLAYINNSSATSTGDITVNAKAKDTIEQGTAFAGSVALAVSSNGSSGIAVTGSGAEVTNKLSSKVYAYLNNSQVEAEGDIEVQAITDTQIQESEAIGVSVSAYIGLGIFTAGVSVSIAASIVENEISNDVEAYISSSTAKIVNAGGDITVSANAEKAKITDITAVAVSVAISATIFGAGASGGGVELDNTIDNNVLASVSGAVDLTAGSDVNILANEDAYLEADATAVSIGAAVISAAIGVALVSNNINSSIQALVDNDLSQTWTTGTTSTTTITSVNTTVAADAIANIDKTLSVGVSAATAAAASGNESVADIGTLVKAYVEGTTLKSSGDVEITATADNTASTSANGGALGALAVGAMVADINLGKGNDIDEIEATIGNGTEVTAGTLRIAATSTDNLLSESVAAGGGVVAIAGAQSNVSSNLATLAQIGNNAEIDVDTLYITSTHEQDIDAFADSFSIAIAAGTGAGVDNTITSKANVDIGTNTNITADNVIINTINRLAKNETSGFGTYGSPNLIAGSASLGNVTVLESNTDIGTSSHPFESVVTVGTGTNITVEGTNDDPGLLEIETLNEITAIDNVRIETVSAFGVSVGLSTIDADTNAAINLNGATLNNKTGDVYLTTRTESSLKPSANLISVSAASAAGATASTTTNATNQITSADTTIKGSDIYLYTGRNSFAVPNLIDSFANAEVTTISLAGISVPVLTAEINETNQIDITGTSSIRALQDVNLVANEGLGGDSRAETDGLVLNLSAIPYGFNIPDGSSVSSTNEVNIGDNVSIEAGINNKSVVQIKPVTLNGVQQLDTAKLGTVLTDAEKTTLGLDVETNYEYGTLDVENITFSISTGTAVQVVAGANAGGTVGNYYEYNLQTNASSDDIILEDEDYSDTSRWTNLGSIIDETAYSVYTSDITQELASDLRNKFYVIKPVDLDDVTLSYANVSNLLYEQRETIISWIASHAGDSEAIARYQAQLDELDQTLEELGLTDTDTNTVIKELDILFVNLPSIYAAPGSIFIEADGANSSQYTSLVGTQLVARAGAEIEIRNESPFTLNVNDVIINDNKRITIIDGVYTVLQPGNVYVNNGLVTSAVDGGDKNISIIQDAYADSQYDLGDLEIPTTDQDIYVLGDVINESGDLLIQNKEGSITVSGELRAEAVTVQAARDFTLSTDDWYHTNQDPRQYLDYDSLRSLVYNTAGNTDTKTFTSTTNINGQNLQTAIDRNTSSILAQGAISITARYLNINGLIQSGVSTIELDIASTFNPGSKTVNFVDDNGDTLSGISFGSDNVPIDGYYDAVENAIVVEEIIPDGGEITLTGQIISTGNGQLKVANGYTSVDINNQSNYKLILSEIDTTTNREGKITIVDSATLKKVEYTVDGSGIKATNYQGTEIPASGDDIATISYTETTSTAYSFSDTIQYQPESGRQYVWTEGQEKTSVEVRKYEKKSFNLIGFNWDDLVKDDSYTWRTVEYRDAQPLLESEAIAPLNNTTVPSYAANTVYTIQYEQKDDTSVDLIQNVSLVRNIANNNVYRYIGANNDLVLSEANFSDTSTWSYYQNTSSSDFEDADNNKFDSDYTNYTFEIEKWTTGGGWLRKKTYHTKTTTITGLKDFYTHTLKADYAVDIDFIQGPTSPKISITSKGELYLQGNIESPDSGTIEFDVAGSLTSADSVAIFGNVTTSSIDGDFTAIIQGSQEALNVVAGGDIDLTIVSEDNLSSSIVVAKITSTSGNVILNAPDGITAQNSSSLISGNQIELYATNGSIGSSSQSIRINSTTGVAVQADGDIYIVETSGDLNLVQPTSATDDTASIISTSGDIYLEVTNGAVVDDFVEDPSVSSQLEADTIDSRVQELIDDGTFSADAFEYPLSSGLYSYLYPNADFLGTTTTSTTTENSNIIGRNVTIKALGTNGEIGQIGDQVSIYMANGFSSLSDTNKELLSSATASDVVGVTYEIYLYVGSDTTGVDLAAADFTTTDWQKQDIDFVTGSDKTVSQTVSLTTGKTVLVQYSSSEYGLYEYIGQAATRDLSKQNYELDINLWQAVTTDHDTETGRNVELLPGELVANKSVVAWVTLQLIEDIDIQSSGNITIESTGAVAVQATDTLPINYIQAGGDVRLQAGDAITDNYTNITAAIATSGDLILLSDGNVQGSGSDQPFRVNLSASSQLSAEVVGDIHIQQVAANTDLYVSRISAGGEADIEVPNGDLWVNAISATTSVNLQAQGSIFDANQANQLNITSATIIIEATQGAIGASDGFLDVEVIGNGVINATAENNIYLNSLDSDFRVGKIESQQQNVYLTALLSIVDANSDSDADILGNNITLETLEGIGTINDALDIDTQNGGLLTIESESSVYIQETANDLSLNQVQITTGTAYISSVGKILDGNIDNSANIQANSAQLVATLGVGTAADAVDTEIKTLAGNGGTGKFWLTNTGTLTVGTVGSVVGITAEDEIHITTKSPLTVIENITSLGAIALHATDDSDDDDNVLITNESIVKGQTVTIFAGDNFSLTENAAINGTNGVNIYGDYGNADTGTGSTIDIQGWIDGASLLIFGNQDTDTFNLGRIRTNTTLEAYQGQDKINLKLMVSGQITINAGDDNDLITVTSPNSSAVVVVNGQNGDDQVNAATATLGITINGDDGKDTIYGGAGKDTINGGLGNDYIEGGAGDDAINGGEGDDTMQGDAGNDTLNGSVGNDTVTYKSSPSGVVVNLDQTRSYTNAGGSSHTTPFNGYPSISSDLEPNFSVNPGNALDGFGYIDVLTNVENIIGSDHGDVFIGDSGDNHIRGGDGDDVLIGNDGNDILDGEVGRDTASYRRDPVAVVINLTSATNTDGFGKTDTLTSIENLIGTAFNDQLTGDANDNTLMGGSGGDILNGGDGNDALLGEAGIDTLNGGNGDDILVGGAGADLINGNTGNDTSSYFTASSSVTADLRSNTGTQGDAVADIFTSIENLEGSEYSDILYGDSNANILSGLGGDDRLYGYGGDNVIYGGNGHDIITADNGNNFVYTGEGINTVTLGNGNNNVIGGSGNDTITTGSGRDIIDGGDGANTIKAGDGNNNVTVGSGGNNITTGTGVDIINTGNGNNIISAGNGLNEIYTGSGSDTITSGIDKDIIKAGDGNNTINAGAGNNEITTGSGNDTITTGTGNDIIKAGDGYNYITAGDGDNVITGGVGRDDIFTGGGVDIIDAKDGDNNIFSYGGNDRITTGTGIDQIDAGEGNNYIDSGAGSDVITSGSGADTILAGEGNNTIKAGDGANVITAGSGRDTITTGVGDDNIQAGEGDNIIYAGNGVNTIVTGSGSDSIYSGTGIDTILAGGGNNTINAGEGNNIITTGSGNDNITTGSGNDTINAGDGYNYIKAGDGNNIVTTGSGRDDIFTGSGNDTINAGDGDNNIDAGNGANIINAGSGIDNIKSGTGDDTINAGNGNNIINAGDGNNIVTTGSGNDSITTGSGNDVIYYGDGIDVIYAGVGTNTMRKFK